MASVIGGTAGASWLPFAHFCWSLRAGCLYKGQYLGSANDLGLVVSLRHIAEYMGCLMASLRRSLVGADDLPVPLEGKDHL